MKKSGHRSVALLLAALTVAGAAALGGCSSREVSYAPTGAYKTPVGEVVPLTTQRPIIVELTEAPSVVDISVAEDATVPVEKEEEAPVDRGSAVQGVFDPDTGVLLNVPFIDQVDRYPTGCESISAVMLCNYYGVPVTPDAFIDLYLDKGTAPFRDLVGVAFGDDPNKVFLGSPYSEDGWGCYGTVIVNALNKFLPAYGMKAVIEYNKPLEQLCNEYISEGHPVVIWATQGMADARLSMSWYVLGTPNVFRWVSPLHCLVLTGYDANFYYFNDPQKGKDYRYFRGDVDAPFASFGMQSITLRSLTKRAAESSSDESRPAGG